jgi:SAM-dependent methyltransferase
MPHPDEPSPAAAEWDRRYAATPRLFRAQPDETLVEVVTPLPPGRAVDLGAGEGRNSLWLASQGWDVTAVDISKEALDRLVRAATSAHLPVRTVVDDIIAFLDGAEIRGDAFDLVVLAYLHPEPAQRAELLQAATRAVAPGGHLFVVAHHRLSHGVAGPSDPSRLYTEDDLRHAAHGLEVRQLEQRHGHSDIAEPSTDVILWARRARHPLTPAS